MRLTQIPQLPNIPPNVDKATSEYLHHLNRAVVQIVQDIYHDLSNGEATLTEFSAAPTTTDVAENQVVVRTDAGNEKLYVNIGGTMFSTDLT